METPSESHIETTESETKQTMVTETAETQTVTETAESQTSVSTTNNEKLIETEQLQQVTEDASPAEGAPMPQNDEVSVLPALGILREFIIIIYSSELLVAVS